MISKRTANVLIFIVTGVWLVNFLAGVFIDSYTPAESINGIFLAIVGGLFALKGQKSDDDDRPKPQRGGKHVQ